MLLLIDIDALLRRGCESHALIGIGASKGLFESTKARLASKACSIELVRFDSPEELVHALSSNAIDAAVRGTLPSSPLLSELKSSFDLSEIMRTAIMRTLDGRTFMLTPVGIDEGKNAFMKTSLIRATLEYFSRIGWSLSVGVLSKGRVDDVHRGDEIERSITEGEEVVEALRVEGVDAEHYAILLEEALEERDVIVAPDGISGNLIFRALHLVGGCEAFGAPVVNIEAIFVDTSRAKSDFSDAVMLAAGLKLI
ncbi:MAG: methanogenesis marker protein Mmp4/MtxX [Candidatus Thermoplasmatota archaeon]|nr:methanogenesis marker protein Mmp4/MtxX [Candidatus Thermoplasmatota archaeon]